MKKVFIWAVLCCLALSSCQAQEVIRLYDGVAPGSEDWTWKEQEFFGTYFDVADPTLTVYPAEKPNGTSLIICPGGGFHMLSFKAEGVNFAEFLNKHGITCFVLRYRLCHADDLKDRLSHLNAELMDSVSKPVIPLMLQDAMTAISYVREHAAEYGVDPHKIGIEGSSAGGTVALGTAMAADAENCRPDFVVGTYPWHSPHIAQAAPKESIPLFLASATDDSFVPVKHTLDFYNFWLEAGYPVEMHIYKEGNHGFVGSVRHMPVDTWQERLVEWINSLYEQE